MPSSDADNNRKAEPPTPDVWFVRGAALVFTATLGLANAAVVVELHSSLRAAGQLIILLNLAALVSGLACLGWVKRRSGGAPLDSYAIAVVGGPFLAWGLDVVIIQAWVFGFR
jgi:hypothetical protein